ncbi:MAG: hypothetical protein ACREVK_05640 [Gammaproteobacteria bacterium]
MHDEPFGSAHWRVWGAGYSPLCVVRQPAVERHKPGRKSKVVPEGLSGRTKPWPKPIPGGGVTGMLNAA